MNGDQSGCQRANALFTQALAAGQDEPAAALPLLGEAERLCPSFHIAFVRGNALRIMRRHPEALLAYESALSLARRPRESEMARAWEAVTRVETGDVCAALKAFDDLDDPEGGMLPEWLREPYAEFSQALELRGGPTAAEITCALHRTAEERSLGACPAVQLRVPFAHDCAAIDEDNAAAVAQLAQALLGLGEESGAWRLIGHTDQRGGAAYNQSLSERRAASVRQAVLDKAPSLAARLRSEGMGESRPLSLGDEEADHQMNRRVEVRAECD